MAGGDVIEAVVRAEPVQHFGRRVLQRLVQRTGVADREDVLAVSPRGQPIVRPFSTRT